MENSFDFEKTKFYWILREFWINSRNAKYYKKNEEFWIPSLSMNSFTLRFLFPSRQSFTSFGVFGDRLWSATNGFPFLSHSFSFLFLQSFRSLRVLFDGVRAARNPFPPLSQTFRWFRSLLSAPLRLQDYSSRSQVFLICGFVFINRQMHCLSKQFWDNFLKKEQPFCLTDKL